MSFQRFYGKCPSNTEKTFECAKLHHFAFFWLEVPEKCLLPGGLESIAPIDYVPNTSTTAH
jgi:hypothetical protein